jgi:3-phosphoshikimate 1-carboxyvinyltransferase
MGYRVAMKLSAPASKSMTQRALIIAALADGESTIAHPLDCDDSRYLIAALRAVGATVNVRDACIEVAPGRTLVAPREALYCGNAGTAVRFGACLSLVCEGALTIDGDAHMRARPIGPLGASLSAMGVAVRYLAAEHYPPMRLERNAAPPSTARVDMTLSSQYASGLLLVAPRLESGLCLELDGALVSLPYLDMTIAMMQRAGADVARDDRTVRVAPGDYAAGSIAIEPDWSAAAFLLAAGRLLGRDVQIDGLEPPGRSLQGDSAFAAMLAVLDGHRDIRFDLTNTPDLIAPLAAACLFANRPSTIRGATHTRIKECDRVAVLSRELCKLGARVDAHDDGLDIEPLQTVPSGRVVLDPEGDHRMAMCFGLVALRVPSIEVSDEDCVSKSFPDFWQVLASLR